MDAPKLLSEDVVLSKFGKEVVSRKYRVNGKAEEFICWGGAKKKKQISPTMIFAMTADQEVVAVRQFRYGVNQFLVEIPGGCPKADESSKEVARQELLEETGYQAENLIEVLWDFPFEPAACFTSYNVVIALGCKKVAEPKLDPTEFLEPLVIPLPKWFEMIRQGEIRDTKTLALTLLALSFRHLKVSLYL
ncbi:MAG: NUDIX hydrolase [Candidatus Moranbacteria bacterium]|nr:NUDIX hydrolase [Candidatus Moranbacteria bacterium]